MDTANDKALQRFAELMIEKIKQVEDNWQKPWFGIKGGGLPQNIEGRTYNGVNSFMLFLLSEKEQYSLPVYMTFMQAKDSGLNILKGEKSFPVIYWNFSVRDKNGKKIPFDVYKNLDKNEQQEYKVTPFLKTYNVFNVQQTNLQETKPEKWEALKEQFKIPAIKDEQGMLTVPLIDAMVREQQWICPIYSNESYIITDEKIAVKSRVFNSVRNLIGPDSPYCDAFAGGTFYHAFLNANDYHRYHFPLSGVIRELRIIPGDDALGGKITWEPDLKQYVVDCSVPGWQSIETRGLAIIETDTHGLVAVMPIGMSQVASVNFTEGLQVGDRVKKGDELGYFLFGGSDFVLVFQKDADFRLISPKDGDNAWQHILMGEKLGEVKSVK